MGFVALLERPTAGEPDEVVALSLPQARNPESSQRDAFFDTVIDRMRALPGVTRVGAAALLSARGRAFIVDEQAPASRDVAPPAVDRVATPEYFATTDIPLLQGRDFLPANRQDAPAVAIVNQTLARTYWANKDPLASRSGCSGRRSTYP